jgi:hypothetical protein
MAWVWFAAFAGPVAWTAHNLLSAAIVSFACGNPLGLVGLHALTAGTLLVSLAGAVAGGRSYMLQTASGTRFLGGVSSAMNVFFGVVIVAEGLPNFLLNPCWS